MKKIISLIILLTSLNAFCCSVSLPIAEIRNQEFYIDFTPVVAKIFVKHGYKVNVPNSLYTFSNKDFISRGNNFLHLTQVNMEFALSSQSKVQTIKSLKNCYNVSCATSDYVQVLKTNLKLLDKTLPNCPAQ